MDTKIILIFSLIWVLTYNFVPSTTTNYFVRYLGNNYAIIYSPISMPTFHKGLGLYTVSNVANTTTTKLIMNYSIPFTSNFSKNHYIALVINNCRLFCI